jgi:hypothetical protein
MKPGIKKTEMYSMRSIMLKGVSGKSVFMIGKSEVANLEKTERISIDK